MPGKAMVAATPATLSSAAMTTQAPITHHLWRNENRPTRNNNDAICVHSLEKTRTFRQQLRSVSC